MPRTWRIQGYLARLDPWTIFHVRADQWPENSYVRTVGGPKTLENLEENFRHS